MPSVVSSSSDTADGIFYLPSLSTHYVHTTYYHYRHATDTLPTHYRHTTYTLPTITNNCSSILSFIDFNPFSYFFGLNMCCKAQHLCMAVLQESLGLTKLRKIFTFCSRPHCPSLWPSRDQHLKSTSSVHSCIQ